MPTSGGVLDASVLLAVVLGEVDAAEAEPWFVEACMSAVNVSEVVARLADLDSRPNLSGKVSPSSTSISERLMAPMPSALGSCDL